MNSSSHLAPDQRIESRKGFVQEPQFRLDGQRPGDPHPLLLATRKLAGKGALAPREPHQRDHLARAVFPLGAAQALHVQRKGHVV